MNQFSLDFPKEEERQEKQESSAYLGGTSHSLHGSRQERAA
jgi:hypothetical protein